MLADASRHAEQAARAAQHALVTAIERDGYVAAADETRIRNTLDRLRADDADPALVRRFERLSCALAELNIYRRQGRCNAHASTLRRLRTTAAS